MNTLSEREYSVLKAAYAQGYIDAHNLTNHFDEVIKLWFANETSEEEDDDDDE